MMLVTGPTGSGKSTTLYAALTEINHGEDKIITIEDPVEYKLTGVLQIPVNENKCLTFAVGLRSILRHDPDTYAYRAQGETAVQPHAVQTISGIPGIYSYDTNGNLLNGGGRTITWTSFDMPQTIKKDAITATFNYGTEHQRVGQLRRGNQVGGADERVIYAGAQEVESGVNGGMKVK